jgi:hypothetical protein
MGVVQAQIQTVEEIYRLVWTAVANKRPIEATYQGRLRLFCPHRLGRNREGRLRVVCYQYGGESQSGLHPVGSPANWRCVALEKLSKVKLVEGAWPGAPRRIIRALPPAWPQPISMRKIIPSAIHRKDIEGVARAGVGPGSFVVLQSNADYAARGERGDPRGRKSGAGPGATNPRWPARAEGEKRFRSATRNP